LRHLALAVEIVCGAETYLSYLRAVALAICSLFLNFRLQLVMNFTDNLL